MNIHDALEAAYKNGYKAAVEDLKKILSVKSTEFDKDVDNLLIKKGVYTK